MSDKAINGTENLEQAYNRAVESAVGAFDTSITQTTAATRLMSDAAEAERKEFGKVIEQGATVTRQRNESLAATLPAIFQGFTPKPGATAPEISPDVKESINKLIESESALYESLAQTWHQYIAGSEQRRIAATKALLDSNATLLDAGQKAAKEATAYGQAYINWSLETATAQNKKS